MGKDSRLSWLLIALRAIREIKEGGVVFPGFGIPMLTIPQNLPPELGITLVSENGIVGHGPIITDATDWEPEATNSGGNPVTFPPGACFTSQHDIFVALSGRHRIDIAFLGAYEVSEKGDVANWTTLKRGVSSIGGAMDIAVGAKKVIVMMPHNTKAGLPTIVKECQQPVTARQVVSLIITDLAVVEVTANGLVLKEIMPGFSVEEVQAQTEPKLTVSDELSEVQF